jgi:DNA helicase-2/ATP-dependent DNA helicase PcrA
VHDNVLLQGLNDQQLQAVTSDSPNILCLAGAGSGKTRVLTHRIAHLNMDKRFGTSNMLALTFTRLAAKEMKERVFVLIGEHEGKKLTIGTFHSFCVQVLREWGHLVGIEPNFTIYDEEDREEIVKSIIRDLGYKKVKVQDVLYSLQDPPEDSPTERVVDEYMYRLAQNNAVDLDGLLVHTKEVLSFHPAQWDLTNRYRYVFVDEFQDTNDVQFEIIQRLSPDMLFLVGDDFQSIYGWRGANVENIIRIPIQFPAFEVVKLERNYRSTKHIVKAANSLITHNQKQTEKKLISDREGDRISYNCYLDDAGEAQVIASIILDSVRGRSWSDYAVLARTNNQIKKVKDVFDYFGIPAQVVNNQGDVFKKHDIRKLLTFIEAAVNPQDNISFLKIINFPYPRLTDLELSKMEFSSLNSEKTLFEESQEIDVPALQAFRNTLDALKSLIDESDTALDVIRGSIDLIGLKDFYVSKGVNNRLGDIDVLFYQVEKWQSVQETLGESININSFLKWLRTKDIQERLVQEEVNAVKLMTVHASKGLEFPVVFVIGLNQNTFPSHRAEDLEEERRLFYVAITRAKEQLYLSRPERKPLFPGGPMVEQIQSQFIGELNLGDEAKIAVLDALKGEQAALDIC